MDARNGRGRPALDRAIQAAVLHRFEHMLGLDGRMPVVEIGPWAGQGNEVAIQVDPVTRALKGACDPRRAKVPTVAILEIAGGDVSAELVVV